MNREIPDSLKFAIGLAMRCQAGPFAADCSSQIPCGRRGFSTFDVPVDLLLRVQVLQALEDLPQDGGDLGLVQGPRLQLGQQTDEERPSTRRRQTSQGSAQWNMLD